MIQHTQVLWDRNKCLEESQTKQQQTLEQNAQQQQVFNQQAQALWNEQEQARGMQTSTESRMQQLQQELLQMREANRNRTSQPAVEKACPQPKEEGGPKDTAPIPNQETSRIHDSYPGKGPSPLYPNYSSWNYWNQPDWYWGNQHWEHMEQIPGSGQRANWSNNTRVTDPGKITADSHGYDPLPSHGYPNMMIDSCPAFTPNTFQNWKREVKLWIAGMPGATVTQILAKLIHALPLSTKTDALLYMESTEKNPESRTVDHIMRLMDTRYGRTDSERACSWLTAFTEFKRESQENYKDFWARFNRCTAKLAALDMPMTQQVIFNRAIQALRLPDGQLPIVLSALEARPDRFSVESLREMTIRMYETHRPKTDTTEVFMTNTESQQINPEGEHVNNHESEEIGDNDSWDDSMSVTLESGAVFLMKPKKPLKPRNAPGMNEAARRGAVNAFRDIPNQRIQTKGGKGGCLRCGDPSHHWKQCPHPFREKLDPRITAQVGYGAKGKQKGKGTYVARELNPNSDSLTANESTSPCCDGLVPANGADPTEIESIEPSASPSSSPTPSINDVWAQYYAQYHESPLNTVAVCSTKEHMGQTSSNPFAIMMAETSRKPGELPPILIDSGASSTVVGEKWFASWKGFKIPNLTKSRKEFHFGDGPAYPSLGTCQLNLIIPHKFTNQKQEQRLVIQVDVVAAVVPLLISQNALARMAGRLDFAQNTLELPSGLIITLIKSPSGHILLPAAPVSHLEWSPFTPLIDGAFSMTRKDTFPTNAAESCPLRKLSDEQVRKVHIQLGHCSQRQLIELLKFAQCQVNIEQISRIHAKCGCVRSVHRITPPVVTSWIARFSGEIVAMDIIYPFTEFGKDNDSRLPSQRIATNPALLIVDSLTRFITCSLLADLTAATVTQAFLRDWVMHFGKPKRIILDQGGPGFTGHEWEKLSHVFGWQYIKAPTKMSHQNGLAERSVRTLKAAIQSIAINEGHMELNQNTITLAVIAKNHAPHAVTGLPPAFAMTGRCDIASGAATCTWEHDPLSHDALIPQVNAVRKIIEARNEIMRKDAEHAVKTSLNHNLPDGKGQFIPIGSSVQIAVGKDWIGTFRVIAHSAGNLLVERGNKILKWPRCRTRLMNQECNDSMDNIPMPQASRRLSDPWRSAQPPDESATSHLKPVDDVMEIPELPDSIDEDDQPLDEWALIKETERTHLSNAVKDEPMMEDHWDTGLIYDSLACCTPKPELTYTCHGTLLCEDYAITPAESYLDKTFAGELAVGSLSNGADQAWYQTKKGEYSDDDVLENFDPSRVPPRVAFRLIPAREAIEKEVNDLLTAKPNEPPAMIQVSLNDSRFKTVPRVQSTIVVKRKGINLYKGRLCVRGDTVPLNTTAFISSPTVHRSGVKIICSLAAQMCWTIHAIDISQAFLQSANLNAKDRVIVLPPNMIQLPWTGKLPPIQTDLNQLPRHSHGFLLIRPLYGGRDAPMRWFIALSERLRQHGFKQLKSDVCMFNKFDSAGNLTGFMIAHVDDLLFCGTERFRKEAIAAIQTFRTGEVETLTVNQPIIFTGLLIEQANNGRINLSQQHYAEELKLMEVDNYVDSTRITQPAVLKSTFKQALGSLIWLHQTRPDIGFTITQLATQIVEACESVTKARALAGIYNKIVKFVKNHPRKIVYAPFPGCESGGITALESMTNWKLIVFTDAGFATLAGSHSIESHVIILGDVIDRDGSIQCHGMLLDHRCAKLHRVCRSTLAAEAHAAVTAVDVALWMQVLLIELFTGRFDYARLTPPTEFPIKDPFSQAPTNQEVKQQTGYDKLIMLTTMMHSANPLLTPTETVFQTHCRECGFSCKLNTISVEQIQKESTYAGTVLRNQPVILFHPLVLTDCCSLYSSMLRLQPKATERCTRITLGFLRDSMKLIAFSFVDAGVNLGDVGTKHAGSLGILDHFLATGRFSLSFMRRKQRKAIKG